MEFRAKNCIFCDRLMVVGRGGMNCKCVSDSCYQKYMYSAGHGVKGLYIQFVIDSYLFNYLFNSNEEPKGMSCVGFNIQPSPESYEITCHVDVNLHNAQQVFERIKKLASLS